MNSWTVQHYATLKDIIGDRLLEMQNKGVERIVFYGVSNKMEVTYVAIQKTNIELVGVAKNDENWKPIKIFGFELRKLNKIIELDPDAVFITSIEDIIEPILKRLENLFGFKKRVLLQHL